VREIHNREIFQNSKIWTHVTYIKHHIFFSFKKAFLHFRRSCSFFSILLQFPISVVTKNMLFISVLKNNIKWHGS